MDNCASILYKEGSYVEGFRLMVLDNYSLKISTVNGSGSQSANNIIVKSLFRSGYHVSGKNIFPSNIAGLPTLYTVRAVSYTHLTLPTICSV